MKQIIRLTESDLHRLISESVKRVLWESEEGNDLEDLENRVKEAAEKMKALKGKKNMNREFALAAQEWRKLKDELDRKRGTFKELVNPSHEEIEKINKERERNLSPEELRKKRMRDRMGGKMKKTDQIKHWGINFKETGLKTNDDPNATDFSKR